MKLKILFAAIISALTLSSCAHLNSVSVSSIPAQRANEVSAESNRWIILGFNFDNDYVDAVRTELSRKCPNGKISGILTKDEIYDYFLVLVQKRHIQASGYCEKAGAVAASEVKK